jgi:hypothetical protein
MAISHADHDHPNTPAARAKCRKAMASGGVTKPTAERKLAEGAGLVKPARWAAVEPLGRGAKRGPRVDTRNRKRPNTALKSTGDLADVPRMLAYGVRMAWALDYPVRVGDQFNDLESRIVIDAPAGEIALVWKPSLPDGVWGVFFRPGYKSVTNRVDSVQFAFALGAGEDADG